MTIELTQIIFLFITGVPVIVLTFYGLVIVYYGKKGKNSCLSAGVSSDFRKNRQDPFVSVVIATHNEEMIISKKIENLLSSDYPNEKIEFIFSDDSTDSTPKIILEKSKEFPSIRLLRFEKRMGYSPSTLAGCKAAKGEIIILNDAGSFLDSHSITRIVSVFENPKIGVVTGKDVILNTNESVGKSEGFYQRIYNFLRLAETNMGSTFYTKGEATGVRRTILDGFDSASETFDTTVGLIAKQKGYNVIYDPEVSFSEYAPDTRSGMIKQKTIRAANLIKVLWRFRFMMFKRKYGKYGALVLPFNFGMLTFVPIYILLWFISLLILTLFTPGFFIFIWAIVGVVAATSIIFSRRLFSIFIDFEYSLLKANFQVIFVRKSHDKIDKVLSTRRAN